MCREPRPVSTSQKKPGGFFVLDLETVGGLHIQAFKTITRHVTCGHRV